MNTDQRKELGERLTALTRDIALIPSTDERPEERQRCFEFCLNHLDAVDGVTIREFEKNGYTSIVALPANGRRRKSLVESEHSDSVRDFFAEEVAPYSQYYVVAAAYVFCCHR